MPGVLFGSFANRNSTGLFLVACVILLALLPPLRPLPGMAWLKTAGGTVLAVGIVLTGSRSAMALGAAVLLAGLLGWLVSRKWAALRLRTLVLGTPAVAALSLAAIAVLPGRRAAVSLDRLNRKRVVYGKSVSVRVSLGGRRLTQTKTNNYTHI